MPLAVLRSPALVDGILLLMLFIWFGGSALLTWLATRRDQPMLVASTQPVPVPAPGLAERTGPLSSPLAAPAEAARI
jgi:hypothetical protein